MDRYKLNVFTGRHDNVGPLYMIGCDLYFDCGGSRYKITAVLSIPPLSFFLQEDGLSFILLEDGFSKLALELVTTVLSLFLLEDGMSFLLLENGDNLALDF